MAGPGCYCGRTGCIETFSRGRAWRETTQARTGRALDRRGHRQRRGRRGDADARETIARYERRLARGLASVINVVDPDAIVLGGGLSNIERLYERVPAAVERVRLLGRGHDSARPRRARRLERRARRGVAVGLTPGSLQKAPNGDPNQLFSRVFRGLLGG